MNTKNKLEKIGTIILMSILVIGCAGVTVFGIFNSKKPVEIIEESVEIIEETTIEEPKIEVLNGKIKLAEVKVVYDNMEQGEQIKIIGEDDDYYFFHTEQENKILAINKKFVRTEEDDEFEKFTGYTKKKTNLYKNYSDEEAYDTIAANSEISVNEEIDDKYVITLDNQILFISKDDISKSKIKSNTKKSDTSNNSENYNNSNDYNSDNNGGNSEGKAGGSSSGNDSNPQPPVTPKQDDTGNDTGKDGEDIELARFVKKENNVITVSRVTYENEINGIVKIPTETYIAILYRGDEVKVIKEEGNYYIVDYNGENINIAKESIRLENEESYEEKEMYALNGAVIYKNINSEQVLAELKLDDAVSVVDEVNDYYIVEYFTEDGEKIYGYIDKISLVSEIVETEQEENKQQAETRKQETTNQNNNQQKQEYYNDQGSRSGSEQKQSSQEPQYEPPVETKKEEKKEDNKEQEQQEPEWTEPEL